MVVLDAEKTVQTIWPNKTINQSMFPVVEVGKHYLDSNPLKIRSTTSSFLPRGRSLEMSTTMYISSVESKMEGQELRIAKEDEHRQRSDSAGRSTS